ncbi:hypothetical protein WJX72_007053 [[Myrmecia] bisecta]|uniref:Uncharacterized protein n=1 Tax=[Myrmecia] bisecta TaxID=41462 RepID=A0AAW1PKW9_9CHLO
MQFRDCGRGRELLETAREETTELSDGQSLLKTRPETSFSLLHESSRPQGQPVQADVGEALEHFLKYAEELKQQVSSEDGQVAKKITY